MILDNPSNNLLDFFVSRSHYKMVTEHFVVNYPDLLVCLQLYLKQNQKKVRDYDSTSLKGISISELKPTMLCANIK